MSVNGVTGSRGSSVGGLFATGSRDLFAGLVTSVVSVAYGLSFAALIFAPPLTPWIAYGMAATFLTSAISASIMAARSSLPFAIAGPDGSTAAVTASLVTALIERLAAGGAPDDLLAPVMIVLALAAALTGILLCGLGLARAGGAIRFIPYPVIGGFLGATGWLMVGGAVRVITDRRLNFSTIDDLLGLLTLAKLAAAGAVALALYLSLRRLRNPFVLPGILLAGIAAADLAFALPGTTLGEAQAEGWMFKAPAAVGLTQTWDLSDLRNFPWRVVPALSGDLLAVMFVTAISMLLNTTGIEFVTKREADLQRELKTLGIANLAAAALGGYASCTSLSRTTLNYAAGGRGRICGLTVAAVSVVVLTANPGFLAYVPKFVLGGLLLYLGSSLMYGWLVELGAANLPARIRLAPRHRAADHSMGLHRRRADRRDHRMRHLRGQREPGECDQIQLRWLGIPLLARSQARGARRPCGTRPRDPRHEPAELSVLWLGQQALSASQDVVCEPA